MSVKSEPTAAKIRIAKWAKLADNPHAAAVNVQPMWLSNMDISAAPVKPEPTGWISQVKFIT